MYVATVSAVKKRNATENVGKFKGKHFVMGATYPVSL